PMKKNTLLIGLLALILNACTIVPSEAVEATFQWDRNPEEDVSSYRIEIYNDKTSTWFTLGTTDDNPTTALIDPPVILVVPNFANKL
ncbi:hypothetical protein ACI3QN_12910, partial [Propionibacterium freudenreichii]|uniref:hypothetical protein n=1 Tax=Propionibacterium freudenreichii TaxID=1744 RepID=UPI00385420F3